jgi:hypothetical protein
LFAAKGSKLEPSFLLFLRASVNGGKQNKHVEVFIHISGCRKRTLSTGDGMGDVLKMNVLWVEEAVE